MAFTEVEGTIARTFFNGKGAELVEAFKKRDGSEGSKRWALWFKEPHGLIEGDGGKFRGSHNDEIDEWEKDGQKRHTIKRSLNDTRQVETTPRSTPAADTWAPPADTGAAAFPAPAGFFDETPF